MLRKRKTLDAANYVYGAEAGKILGFRRVTFYMCTIKTYLLKGGRIVQSGKKSKKRSAKVFQIDQFDLILYHRYIDHFIYPYISTSLKMTKKD